MGADAIAKRWFPAIVCGLIVLAAYLQARGCSALIARELLIDTPEAVAPPSVHVPLSPPGRADPAAGLAAILERNPFDSTTGRLDEPSGDEGEAHGAELAADPYDDPACDSGRVLLIMDSTDDAWSFAAISRAGGEALLRREGDAVGSRQVLAIGWDRVWLGSAHDRCQLRLGMPDPARPAPAPAPALRPPQVLRAPSRVPPEIAAKIRQVGEREFTIDRSALDMVLEKQAELMRWARVSPAKRGDEVVGLKLRVAPNSLFTMLGMQTGDELHAINGFAIADPQKALEAYARLRTADRLRIALSRGGQEMTLDYRIQ